MKGKSFVILSFWCTIPSHYVSHIFEDWPQQNSVRLPTFGCFSLRKLVESCEYFITILSQFHFIQFTIQSNPTKSNTRNLHSKQMKNTCIEHHAHCVDVKIAKNERIVSNNRIGTVFIMNDVVVGSLILASVL